MRRAFVRNALWCVLISQLCLVLGTLLLSAIVADQGGRPFAGVLTYASVEALRRELITLAAAVLAGLVFSVQRSGRWLTITVGASLLIAAFGAIGAPMYVPVWV